MRFIYYSLPFEKKEHNISRFSVSLTNKKNVIKAILEYPGNLISLMRKLSNK